jgi:hypothetical protein
MESNFPELESKVAQLKELGKTASFTISQKGKDWWQKQKGKSTEGSRARAEYMAKLDNTILPLLKTTFPGKISDQELLALRRTMGDVDLHPDEKALVLDSFIEEQISKAQSLKRKLGGQPTKQKVNNDPLGIR